jgi:pyridoxamine 5'-phosphate oxidase
VRRPAGAAAARPRRGRGYLAPRHGTRSPRAFVRVLRETAEGRAALAAVERGKMPQREFEQAMGRLLGLDDDGPLAKALADLQLKVLPERAISRPFGMTVGSFDMRGTGSVPEEAGGQDSVMDRTLTSEMLDGSPLRQFTRWFEEATAAGLPEPNAMVLTTLGDRPHARTVLLKSHDGTGFTFYTNRTSRKGSDLAADQRCCALFPWYALGRQVTVEGSARPLSTAESEPYFHSRPWRSQIGAWASRQSRVLASRAELDDRVAELSARWPEGTQVPMPDFWGGYLIVPDAVEFWQSRQNRLHDRLRYRRSAEGWSIERLSP